ncbi:MAG: hypothetical protein K8S97_00225 [Anaerolineae bacterium]|nr:hypothetical protein [Anaerolineae bacterium]
MGDHPDAAPDKPDNVPADIQQGQAFIAEVHRKMNQVVQEFAGGQINRTQFHHLYDRYQRQIMRVTQLMTETDPGNWQKAIKETEDTILIKKRLTAKAIGMSVYYNKSGMPLETLGEFAIEADLIIPMLSSYRSAAAEIFRAGMRSTVMENGQWLCFVPGDFTTLIVLFSLEPSDNQMAMIERMHQDFEKANQAALEAGHVDPSKLAYPFYSFVQRRAKPRDNEK